MAVSYASITGRVTFPGSDTGLPGLVTAVPLTRAAGLVITGDRLTQGVVSAPVDADGNLPVGGLKVPIVSVSGTPVLWRVVFEPASVMARSEIGNKGLLPWQFYIGPITASATVQALATMEPTAILANFPASALAQVATALAGSESARDQALAAAAAATQLATSDGQTASNVTGGTLTKAALSASYVRLVKFFEMVINEAYGDSYINSTRLGSVSQWAARLASRLRMVFINRGISGTRMDEILNQIVTYHSPNSVGLISLGDVVINDLTQYADDAGRTTTARAFEAGLAWLSAWDVQAASSAAFSFGPGWTAGVADGTAGRFVDVAVTGDAAFVRIGCVTGAGATVTIKDQAGNTLSTTTTGGYKNNFTGVIPLRGLGAGTHQLRLSVTAATTIVGLIVPMPQPPPILWLRPGPYLKGGAPEATRLALYLDACAAVAADFPQVLTVGVDAGWNTATMLRPSDQLHPNDRGHTYLADRAAAVLDAAITGFTQGLNSIVGSGEAGVYTVPTASYTKTGATAPAAPTGVSATAARQATVSWSIPDDGGATLTGFVIEGSTNGGTSWAQVATAGRLATTVAIASGLAAGSSYTFRVKATNAIGSSAGSAPSAAVVAGTVLTYYSTDALTTTATPNAPIGNDDQGHAWNVYAGVAYVRTTTGATPNVVVTDRNFAVVNDGASDGIFQVTFAAYNSPGLLLCMSSDFATGYKFLYNTNNSRWELYRLTTVSTQTLVGSFAVALPAVPIAIEVTVAGSTITCKVNGTTVITATDSTYRGTSHGLYAYGTTTNRFTDWRHFSAA